MYEFKESDAYDFARSQGIETETKGNQLHFKTCPYCKPGMKNRDNLKTFSINLKTGVFKCLRESCGVQGNMITLSRDFDFSLGHAVDEYYRPKKEFKRLKTPKIPIVPKAPAITYLESRGIPEEIAKLYEITTRNDDEKILVFPFYDEEGKLQFVKYRNTDFNREKDKNKEWCEASCKPILFGMKQCDLTINRLILTEGQMDSLSVAAAGIKNAVSVPTGAKGFTWIPYCYDWMKQFEELIIFGDFEKGRISLLAEMKERFPNKVRHVREEDYLGCKDANEILFKYGQEAIKKAIENAKQVEIRSVIPLASVEAVNIYKLEKLRTGISRLDQLLYGGLPFGTVCLLGGKRGDGKSTLGSQILSNAIDCGYNVFAYSGELPNYLFKSWIDFQIAGPFHITENDNYGIVNRFITERNQELINSWYEEKAYLYDNRLINGSEYEDLLKIIENVIRKYGVRVILIDNLMTAMYLDDMKTNDKYEQQGRFVRELTKIALRFDVLILLIAHRRKNGFSTDANDEISGSGDITNLASITMSYDRPEKNENAIGNSPRKLILAKNRLFGKTDFNGILLDYDDKSKRIYEVGKKPDWVYGWDKDFVEQLYMDNPFMEE